MPEDPYPSRWEYVPDCNCPYCGNYRQRPDAPVRLAAWYQTEDGITRPVPGTVQAERDDVWTQRAVQLLATWAATMPRPRLKAEPELPSDRCGTVGGYRKHLQADEKPCEACFNAECDDLEGHRSDESVYYPNALM
jgi:hypothetical protein